MCVLEFDLVVWEHQPLQHTCLGVRAITHPTAAKSGERRAECGAAQLFLLTVITITVSITSSMTAPFNSTPPKNLSHTHTHAHTSCCSAGQSRVPEVWTHWQAVWITGIAGNTKSKKGPVLCTHTLYIEHGRGLHSAVSHTLLTRGDLPGSDGKNSNKSSLFNYTWIIWFQN